LCIYIYIFKNLTTDQPKGQRGLISMAEEEGKGKGNIHLSQIAACT